VIAFLSAVQILSNLRYLEGGPVISSIAGIILGTILIVHAVDWVLNKISERRTKG